MAAVIKPRTAIIIALTVIAVAVSSLVLLPRWQAADKEQSSQLSRTNPESLRDQSKPLAAFLNNDEDLQAGAEDREAMWKPPPPGHPKAPKKSVLSTPNSRKQKPQTREVVHVDQTLLQKLNTVNFESRPHDGMNLEENGANTSKYEKLKSLLREPRPHMEAASGLGNEKPKLPNVLEKVAVGYKASVLTTTSTITSPVSLFRFTNPSSLLLPLSPMNKLPSMKRGSVEIRPERLPPPAHSSDIYISLLTAPKFHDTRVSLLYLTWLQTINPKQVSLHDRN